MCKDVKAASYFAFGASCRRFASVPGRHQPYKLVPQGDLRAPQSVAQHSFVCRLHRLMQVMRCGASLVLPLLLAVAHRLRKNFPCCEHGLSAVGQPQLEESTACMAREAPHSGKCGGNLQKETLRKQRDSGREVGRTNSAQLFYFFTIDLIHAMVRRSARLGRWRI
jgi:hypothetical protein